MPTTAAAERSARTHFRAFTALIALLVGITMAAMPSSAATAAVQRVDLRVLVLDDHTAWVGAITSQLVAEGVPFTAVDLTAPSRPPITDVVLADGDHARFQAVVAPSAYSLDVAADEWAAIRTFEAKFSIREVDGFNWPGSTLGLAAPSFTGDMTGMTATATPVAVRSGFQYLSGPVPFSAGSYAFLSAPLTATSTPALPAGASFSTFIAVPAPDGTPTSVIGVYTHDGLEQMVITAAMAYGFPQFKTVAHGIVSWMTRGVHLGQQRNYLTFHVDDAFVEDAQWDPVHHCTPGEDCPRDANGNSLYPETSVRMTADDVAYAVAWEASRQYTLTLAFNGRGIATGDALTTAFQTSASSFRWLNHGLEHLYQGCTQDFSVVPWQCATDPGGAVQWVAQSTIASEISTNVTAGRSIGLPFDTSEYLSGEHSGLAQPPQQLVDNPNFASAVAAAGIHAIGADASREAATRLVGGAVTVPRHPTALYYNTSTATSAVDEYNWLYTSRANGGGGYCEDNPATATCITPLDPASGFAGYIVPTDAAFDLGFVLSNDPRPFYAHTSNMTGDRLLYPLLDTILSTYRTSFATNTPLVNLTLTQAATALQRQAKWTTTDDTVTAYVEDGVVTIVNPTGAAVPLTMPAGSTLAAGRFESYGGELSAWLTGTTLVGTLPATQLTIGGSTSFAEGRAGTLTVRSSTASATLELAGALPAGLVWTNTGPGSYTVSGTPAAGTAGNYPVTVTATSASGLVSRDLVLTVARRPIITSPASAWFVSGVPFSFTATASGVPNPAVRVVGLLPPGYTVVSNPDGSATITGVTTFLTSLGYRLTVTATNAGGSVSQTLTLRGATRPVFTSTSLRTVRVARTASFTVSTTATPRPTLTALDPLPAGLTFRDRGDGTALVSGVPQASSVGVWKVRVAAANVAASVVQTITITVTL